MHRRLWPAAAGTVLLALAACSSAPASSSSSAAAPAAPIAPASTSPGAVNPVTILKDTGATPVPGTVTGSTDVYGDRYASGSFPGGEQVTVYTSATQAAFTAEEGRVPQPDDIHGLVTIPGRLAVITTTGVVDVSTGGNQWGGPAPAQIAARVSGLVSAP